LQQLANYHRKQFNIPIIGITGSNGKTTTKELIAAVLKEKHNIHYTQGNLNNHIGVPLTLLTLEKKHEIAIIEMGANKPGDIKELVEIAEPTHGIITNIGRAHLEGFGSLEGVINTKTEMYRFIVDKGGKLLYNLDDKVLSDHLIGYKNTGNYSGIDNGEVNGKLINLTPFVEFKWSTANYTSPILSTKLVGQYNFYNFLAAVRFGLEFDVDPSLINQAIENYTPNNNRSQVEKTAKNTLILDAYNANPTSMRSALESFEQIQHDKKAVILGDMLELGHESQGEHQAIIDYISRQDWLKIIVGKEFSKTEMRNIHHFQNVEKLGLYLETHPLNDALILIKGSRGIQLERIVDKL
jgi:UDP-N-acetylmuramoyl-tripeptide--D-alanyl-D-alanine ligase